MLVTGATSGIGRATAVRFLECGAHVVFSGRNAQVLAEIKASYASTEHCARVATVAADLASVEQCRKLVASACTALPGGKIDILVNNAGIYDRRSIEATTEEQFDKMLAVNTKGPFLGIKLALEALKASGNASIVNLSSTAGLRGSFAVHYGASKGALRLMTKSIASTYAKDGIRCNSVHPGPIDTEMGHTAVPPDQLEERLYQRIPMGRFGTAEEVANVIKWLLTEAPENFTGQILHTDGGMSNVLV